MNVLHKTKLNLETQKLSINNIHNFKMNITKNQFNTLQGKSNVKKSKSPFFLF